MQGTPAIYLGRIVSKNHFRVVIYNANQEKKLVKSWDEFEECMQSGIWFATIEDAIASNAVIAKSEVNTINEKPKRKPKPKPKKIEEPQKLEEEQLDIIEDDGSVFEVKDGQ